MIITHKTNQGNEMNTERRIQLALDYTSKAMDESREGDKAVLAIFERVFPEGCPKESGAMLGAYNMLSELLRNSESVRSSIINSRRELIALTTAADGDESLNWLLGDEGRNHEETFEELSELHNAIYTFRTKLDAIESIESEADKLALLSEVNKIGKQCGAAYGKYTYLFDACGNRLREIYHDFWVRLEKTGEYED